MAVSDIGQINHCFGSAPECQKITIICKYSPFGFRPEVSRPPPGKGMAALARIRR